MGSGKPPDGDGSFDNAPIFNFNDDKLKFNTNDVSNVNDNYGSVSGFVSPKYHMIKQKVSDRVPFVLFLRWA